MKDQTPTAAPCCVKALRDATKRWPKRSKVSDGIMGDVRHQKTKSDHNLGNAFDLTHDPENGVDCNALAELLVEDVRVKYVIWNKRICNPLVSKIDWRPYLGVNPHDKHLHVSIFTFSREDLSPWPWSDR